MAKFAKTTEVDISAMHEVVEEQAPKKNKWFTIIPIVLSVMLAFGLWIYVTENSTDLNTVTYNIEVENATDETMSIVAEGTNSNLADLQKENIKIVKEENGTYTVTIKGTEETVLSSKQTVDGKNYVFEFTTKNITWSVKSK